MNEARQAPAPQVDVVAAVRARLAAEPAPLRPREWWEEFARLFATPRFSAACVAAVVVVSTVAAWQVQQQLNQIDPLWATSSLGELRFWAVKVIFS